LIYSTTFNQGIRQSHTKLWPQSTGRFEALDCFSPFRCALHHQELAQRIAERNLLRPCSDGRLQQSLGPRFVARNLECPRQQ
jgi:hypothetical protein